MLDSNQILLIVLFIVLAIVVFFELRFMRSRNKDHVEKAMDKDEAYNNIATTRAIATSLKQKGRDTREADLEITRAELSYKRGNFVSSRESAMKARDILVNAPIIEIAPPVAVKAKDGFNERPDEDLKRVQAVKKLEPNMMESRFIINFCKDRIQNEDGTCKDLPRAREHLAKAEACYEGKRYDEALREGMKARRIMGETSEPQDTVKEVPLVKVSKPEMRCSKCANPVSSDDAFCRKCGTPIEVKRMCTHCQAELAIDDVFCPKCGRQA